MANLETLELTISANAQSASQGLNNLINSLTSLSGKVSKAVGSLKSLNSELATLKGYSGLKIPALSSSKTANNIKAVTKAVTAQKKAIEDLSDYDWGNRRAVNKGDSNAKPYEQWKAEYDAIGEAQKAEKAARDALVNQRELQRAIKENPVVKYLDNAKQASNFVQDYINQSQGIGRAVKSAAESASVFQEQMGKTVSVSDKAKSVWSNFKQGAKNLGQELKSLVPKFSALHKVMRIASTMLIRMGIRALFKGIKEGFNNYYQYSKTTGGAFAKEMDSLSSAWAQLKNQMGAAIAPAIGAVIPILNAITSAAISAFNALSQLFALLSGSSSWSKATAQVSAFDAAASKAGGGGGGMNELLAKFDEFNIIANEGGGGGGGGAAGEEFATMFEEMWDFDSKIRALADFIRDTISWVKENFTVLLETAGLIGVAILGWKISKAFEGVISTLGSWIMGGALISVGLVIGVDFGQKLGEQLAGGNALSGYDIVEGIAGFLAAAIGGYVIGGVAGLAVGVGFTVLATLVGISIGAKNYQESLRWGSVEFTPEQVKQYVQSMFTFDIYAEVDVVGTKLKNAIASKLRLSQDIKEFSATLGKIELKVDTSPGAFEDAKAKVETIIADLKEYTSSSENLLTAYLQVMPYKEDEKKGMLGDITKANSILNAYIEGEGKKIADLYDQGMRNEWKNNEKEQISALMDHLYNIFNAAEQNSNNAKFKAQLASTKVTITDLTKGTAKAVLNEQKKILEDYRQTMYDAMLEQVAQLEYFATIAEEAGLLDPETGRALADVYRENAAKLVSSFESGMETKLGEVMPQMKQEWIDALTNVYGTDYKKAVTEHIGVGFQRALSERLRKDEESAKELVRETLQRVVDINPITRDASELFGISGWELLEDTTKSRFVDSIYKAIGFEGIKILKSTLNISASEIVSVTNWQAFSATEKLQFVKALSDAYGTTEALRVAKAAGMNIGQEIANGLSSKDSVTRSAAGDLVRAIDDELRSKKISVGVGASIEVEIDAIVNVTPMIQEVINTGNSVVSSMQSTAQSALNTVTSALSNFGFFKASGAYGIPAGDVFIANEAGAELVGSINGKTSVANQEQIIEGIQRGVAEANTEQNNLLRQQNALLQSILEKDSSVRLNASAALGRVAKQSIDMYGSLVGG